MRHLRKIFESWGGIIKPHRDGKTNYSSIKDKSQYGDYCSRLMFLLKKEQANNLTEEENIEIEILSLLIEKWDDDYNTFNNEMDPIELLHYLMDNHGLSNNNMAVILGVDEEYVSKIMNYKRKMTSNMVEILANHFKMNHEAFDREY